MIFLPEYFHRRALAKPDGQKPLWQFFRVAPGWPPTRPLISQQGHLEYPFSVPLRTFTGRNESATAEGNDVEAREEFHKDTVLAHVKTCQQEATLIGNCPTVLGTSEMYFSNSAAHANGYPYSSDELFDSTIVSPLVSVELKKVAAHYPAIEKEGCPFKVITGLRRRLSELSDSRKAHDGTKDGSHAHPVVHKVSVEPVTRRLKVGTSKLHRAAENVLYVRRFLRGGVSREEYVQFILGLYHVYSVMEGRLDTAVQAGNQLCKAVDFPEVRRVDSLRRDLNELVGVEEAEKLIECPLRPAVRAYCDRLSSIPSTMLLAHCYTRYLGDLSGGQILRKAAKRHLGCDCPTHFYEFEEIGNCQAMKDRYKSAIDSCGIAADVADALVEESLCAYALNVQLFEEMDFINGYASRVQTLQEIMDSAQSGTSGLKLRQGQQARGKKEGCPFLPTKIEPRCPWPFILLHDPLTGFRQHPMASIGLSTGAALTAAFIAYSVFCRRFSS
ncbi:Heme oxygenase 2 [Perkinsus olseni]|uniref:Heme oxygenase 2 n=1 Tax=Perkinsus olseni TaxID=32597 RepID=A0A7J6SVR6_PEROL|nr:Heme oxygenase 2 [Perkinsus olseni]